MKTKSKNKSTERWFAHKILSVGEATSSKDWYRECQVQYENGVTGKWLANISEIRIIEQLWKIVDAGGMSHAEASLLRDNIQEFCWWREFENGL